MHFRLRGKTVQVIRTKYDAKTKKAKSEIVGKIQKLKPELTDELKKACSADEQKEVQAWIAGYANTEKLKYEYAARTLAEQISMAAQWFLQQKGESARLEAATIMTEWASLRGVLRKQGFIE